MFFKDEQANYYRNIKIETTKRGTQATAGIPGAIFSLTNYRSFLNYGSF
jgi:hypothetical protein